MDKIYIILSYSCVLTILVLALVEINQRVIKRARMYCGRRRGRKTAIIMGISTTGIFAFFLSPFIISSYYIFFTVLVFIIAIIVIALEKK